MCETHILETKNVGLYTWRGGGGRVSEKVYCLYTHENVDIFGWPLSPSVRACFDENVSTTATFDAVYWNTSHNTYICLLLFVGLVSDLIRA